MNHRPLNVLVIGSGMYVCGRGTKTFGTILPSLFEARRRGLVERITIVGRDPTNRNDIERRALDLAELMGVGGSIDILPSGGEPDSGAYRSAARTGDFDCAIVSVPDHLHYEVVSEVIRAKLHCLVVKPFVPTLDEAVEIVRLQEEHDVYGAVEFHKRFDETNLAILRLIREGRIGDLLYVLVEFSQRRSIPLEIFRAWAEQTNIFQYLGVHYVDLLWYFTGARPVRVLATGQKNVLAGEGIETWDSIQGIIEWEPPAGGSFVSTILTGWVDPPTTTAMSDQKIKLVGSRGRIECDQKERGLRLVSTAESPQDLNPYFSDLRFAVDLGGLEFHGYGNDSIRLFLADCHDLASGRRNVADLRGLRPTFREALVSTAVIDGANRSLRNGSAWTSITSLEPQETRR